MNGGDYDKNNFCDAYLGSIRVIELEIFVGRGNVKFFSYLITILSFQVFGTASLQANTITYDLTGSLEITNIGAGDSLGLDGESFELIAVLTDFTPTFVNDPNINARADYEGDGTLTLGATTPLVNIIDLIFVDTLPGLNDFTTFAVRTPTGDFLFAPFFSPSANDVLFPPPTYPNDPVLFGSLLIPGSTTEENIVYNFVDPILTATVPIPAAAWLFGSALLGLGAVKRKKA